MINNLIGIAIAGFLFYAVVKVCDSLGYATREVATCQTIRLDVFGDPWKVVNIVRSTDGHEASISFVALPGERVFARWRQIHV
jgi:hypothetical protein